MDEQTKQFVIKILVAGAIVLGLYFIISPYQNCARTELAFQTTGLTLTEARLEAATIRAKVRCRQQTTW
jgi:hypothetical protein